MKNFRKNQGITLIALVITVIVLLILAGVTIVALSGDNGLLNQVAKAKEKTQIASEDELRKLTMLEAATNLENTIYTDKNKETATIPAGFAVSQVEGENIIEDGLVIIDANGNEFVWIPCNINGENENVKYQRIDFGKQFGNYSDYSELMPEDEKISIENNGGFYIGRYEAGIDTERTESSEGNTAAELGKVLIQKNKIPYTYVYKVQADNLSIEFKDVYGYSNAITRLCSSYAWDTTLKFISQKYPEYPINSIQGNYNSESIKSTGETIPVCNIYDMGGNVWEWTSESYNDINGTSRIYVGRGGRFSNGEIDYPASYRNAGTIYDVNNFYGFRIMLFLQ